MFNLNSTLRDLEEEFVGRIFGYLLALDLKTINEQSVFQPLKHVLIVLNIKFDFNESLPPRYDRCQSLLHHRSNLYPRILDNQPLNRLQTLDNLMHLPLGLGSQEPPDLQHPETPIIPGHDLSELLHDLNHRVSDS